MSTLGVTAWERLRHCITLGCATGPEEATRRGEPLEGPVIDFFRPILGFLFRTLVRCALHSHQLYCMIQCARCTKGSTVDMRLT